MSDDHKRTIVPSKGGVFQDLAVRLKLILRLMADPRINPLLKLLPIGSLVYLVVPDLVIGPVDDAAILWLGTYLFVELCPPEIVQEHMKALTSTVASGWRDAPPKEEEIVDAEYWEEKQDGGVKQDGGEH
jgi:hypothetical protein